ncbi:MAG: hypothetical protein IH621_04275, partial [Krumholzibacteria bacterium]|nr:hypothetical protein [Candidatus Krumholzibacteria bacterium]
MIRRRLTLVLPMALLAIAAVVPAAIDEYSQDFRSWQQRDPGFTTALWDTVAGELRLPPELLRTRGALDTPGQAYAVAAAGAELKKLEKPCKTREDITSVASISANNDPEIGKIIADALEAVGKDGVVTVEE